MVVYIPSVHYYGFLMVEPWCNMYGFCWLKHGLKVESVVSPDGYYRQMVTMV